MQEPRYRVLCADQVEIGDRLPELAYDVTATTVVLGALASRDWRPMHHDYDFAVNRNGVRNIFLNTPNQALWFERFVTDWTGPRGRLGRVKFKMMDSVFPGDRMVFQGSVKTLDTDEVGCCWASLDVTLLVGEKTMTTCAVRVALPAHRDDNPWKRAGSEWRP